MAETSSLLNCRYRKVSTGSNPVLSAKVRRQFSVVFFLLCTEFVQSVAFRATNLCMDVVCCRKYLSLSDGCL